MSKRNTKKGTITPRGSQVKSKSNGTSRTTKLKQRSAGVSPSWPASDIHFDPQGRLVIRDQKLARLILDTVEGASPLMVIIPPTPIRNPLPPDPANAMCGCNLIKLAPVNLQKLHLPGKQGRASLGLKT